MSYLVCIDPGKTTGAAVFWKQELAHAYYGTPAEVRNLLDLDVVSRAVIELPKWYPRAHNEMDDLITVAVVAGEFKRECESRGIKTELVWPRTWKGSVDKKIHNRRVIEKLTPHELQRMPLKLRARILNHNMIDAVGIGLWKLGRM